MARIVYALFSSGGITGGQKMALRHVETLVDLGFDAVCHLGMGGVAPAWLEHRAPIETGVPTQDGDVIVVPEDAVGAMKTVAGSALRAVVLVQNPYQFAGAGGLEFLASHRERFPIFLTVSPAMKAMLGRLLPAAQVEVARAFADERVFASGEKQLAGALAPRKRPQEATTILAVHRRLFPDQAGIPWGSIHGLTERQTAAAMARAAVFLSLSRLESVGLTTLEAMASGCICAGFTGIGGRSYATPANGFWVAEDDCYAAADALARAFALVTAGGPPLAAMRAAARATAAQWSYACFRGELEAAWMRIAPEARKRAPQTVSPG
jgi:hypothetical protein